MTRRCAACGTLRVDGHCPACRQAARDALDAIDRRDEVTLFKLPEALGGGEYEGSLTTFAGSRYWAFGTPETGRFYVEESALTEVKPPLPEEPPIGAVVMVDGEACQHFDTPYEEELVWASVGSPKRMSWVQLCDLALPGEPTRLLPDPFAERVELPWKRGGVHVQQTHDDGKPSNQVYVSTKAGSYGFAHLKPSTARDMAKALWAAADQAERAS